MLLLITLTIVYHFKILHNLDSLYIIFTVLELFHKSLLQINGLKRVLKIGFDSSKTILIEKSFK